MEEGSCSRQARLGTFGNPGGHASLGGATSLGLSRGSLLTLDRHKRDLAGTVS